jgi:hypothetical protein
MFTGDCKVIVRRATNRVLCFPVINSHTSAFFNNALAAGTRQMVSHASLSNANCHGLGNDVWMRVSLDVMQMTSFWFETLLQGSYA